MMELRTEKEESRRGHKKSQRRVGMSEEKFETGR